MGAHVLIVDDDEGIRGVMEMALATEGYRVSTAASIASALEAVRRGAPDLVFADWRMPGGERGEFITGYRALGVEAPLVVMTAQDEMPEVAADAFLSKPFDLDELLALVRRLTTA